MGPDQPTPQHMFCYAALAAGDAPVVDALVTHVLTKHAPICRQASHRNAHVIIDLEYLPLV